MRAYSIAAPTWGHTLWTTSFTPPKAVDDYPNSTYQGEASVPQIVAVSSQDGVFIMGSQRYGYTPEVWAYSLDTGEQLWEAKTTSTQWYYYGESSNSLSKVIYQGKLLTIYRGGELSAFNVTTGQFLWNWTAPSVGYLETPYTYTPLQLTFFADGKAYFQSYEGAGLNSPIRRDGALWCVDTNTGQMLWRLTCWPAYSNNRMANPVIADGRILALDARDCQIYCFGKGSSATTVTASPKVSVNGDDVLIEGTVTDNSPSGRHNTNGGLDFALKGTPAISDASMEAWMDYMFHQRQKPMNATGVQLSLDTIDPNGNYIHIGNTTSDINGNYAIPYRPQVPGTYQIIATFQGTNSYGSSSATTYLTVSEAPTSTPAATAQPQSIADMYFVPAIVGLFIFVAIIAAAIMLMFRKRP